MIAQERAHAAAVETAPEAADEEGRGLASLLHARYLLYAVFQSLFGREPSKDQSAAIDPALVSEACEIVGLPTEGVRGFIDGLESYRDADAAAVESAKSAYTRLFIGPGALPAQPWESVYVEEDEALFQRSTLDVRNAYRVQGLLPAEYPKVADDHIALECAFLSELARRACEANDAGDTGRLFDALNASGDFLSDHLLAWVDEYAGRLAAADSGLYGLAAKALAEFARSDAAALGRWRVAVVGV